MRTDLSHISFNLSLAQLHEEGMIDNLCTALYQYSMNPAQLEIEITEDAIIADVDKTVHILQQLVGLGIRIVIDDFGKGYPSLSNLKHIPVDVVKIDKGFVKNITAGKNDSKIVETVIDMARDLHVQVVAKGVENKEQLAFLKEHGCDRAQGYLFSPAMPYDECLEFVRKNELK